jgi:hypothetical protein
LRPPDGADDTNAALGAPPSSFVAGLQSSSIPFSRISAQPGLTLASRSSQSAVSVQRSPSASTSRTATVHVVSFPPPSGRPSVANAASVCRPMSAGPAVKAYELPAPEGSAPSSSSHVTVTGSPSGSTLPIENVAVLPTTISTVVRFGTSDVTGARLDSPIVIRV